MRFAAPEDVSEIILSSGPLRVENGFVEVPDDATAGDLGGLAVNGFVAAPDDAPTARAARTSSPSAAVPATKSESTASE